MENILFTNYNELQNFPTNTDYYALLIELLNNLIDINAHNNTEIHKSLHDLRVLNKYESTAFGNIFDIVYRRINKLLLSENNNIALAVLMLIGELFLDSLKYGKFNEWLATFLPNILKISTENAELSGYTFDILNKCATNGFYDDVIVSLLDEIETSQNPQTVNYAYTTLSSLILNCEETLFVESLNWEPIFERICTISQSQTKCIYATQICDIIRQKVSREGLFKILASADELSNSVYINPLFGLNHHDMVQLSLYKERYADRYNNIEENN
jgi:hypothetical protein